MKTKDVGTITAYGYACDYGELDPREVSEREFGERLASYMTVAQEAADSASRAAQAANATGQLYGQTATARDAAIIAKNDAVSAKDTAAEAANVAGRYEAQAESAKTDAESARDTAVNAVDGFAAGAQQALESVNEAGSNWKSLAEKHAGNSEAWAVGQRGGADVPTTDATYHNNAKYYAEQAATDRTTAQTAATNASQSATAAATSASQAAESARTLTIDSTLTKEGQAAGAKETGDAVGNLENKISDLSVEIKYSIHLEMSTDGYYGLNGDFVSDIGRAYCIIPVQSGEVYEISTFLSSTAIAGIIFRNGATVIDYKLRGTGEAEHIIGYKTTIPEGCNNIIVQNRSSTQSMVVEKIIKYPQKSVVEIASMNLNLGPNLVANKKGTQGAGWSGNYTEGWTHATNNNESLSFYSADIKEGAVYICEFDTTYTDDEFVNVGIGSQYRIPVYNGTSHIIIPLLADSEKNLFFTPLSNITFTISNLRLCEVGGTDRLLTINLYNALTNDHTKNYGFWNVLLGKNVADNAVGTTRTVAIGYAALSQLQGGHRNVALGTFAMSQMKGGENNVAIGADSMLAVQKSNDCIAIGKGTMYHGTLVEDNVAIGHYALTGSALSGNSKRNVAIGKNAGWYCYGQDNVFLGYQAGYGCKNTNGNVVIGKNAFGAESGNHNTSIGEQSGFSSGNSNSTAIGYNVKTTKSNQVVIGNGNVTEVVLCGNKKINFNSDGSVTWETLI